MNPATLPPPAWDTWIVGFEAGYAAGLDRGRELEAADLAEDWSALAAKIRAMASVPARAELTERRRWAE